MVFIVVALSVTRLPTPFGRWELGVVGSRWLVVGS
jgi:hypothetical protein